MWQLGQPSSCGGDLDFLVLMMLSFDDNNIVGDRVYSFRVVSSVVMKTEIGRREAGITDEPRNPKKCLVNNGKAKVPPKMSLIRLKAHYDRLCVPRGQLTACSKTLTLQILCVTYTKDVHRSYTRNKDLCDQQISTFYSAYSALNN